MFDDLKEELRNARPLTTSYSQYLPRHPSSLRDNLSSATSYQKQQLSSIH
jgi:hypothetical protein